MKTIIDSKTLKTIEICDSAAELNKIIADTLTYYQDVAERAMTVAAKTKEDVAAEIHNEFEEENKSLRARLHFSYGNFHTEQELNKWKDFCERHANCWDGSKIGSGRAFYVKPYSTGFSTGYIAVCPHCGVEEDISDISWW